MKQIYFYIATISFIILCTLPKEAHAFLFKRKVDSIQIFFDKNQLVLPGESFKIGIISYHRKGKIKKTVGSKGGSVLWWKYKSEIIGGQRISGKITVNEKLLPSKDKYISAKVWPRKKPNLAQTVLISLNYETKIIFNPTNQFDKAPGCTFKGEIISEFDNGIIKKCKIFRSNKDFKNYRIYTYGLKWYRNKFTIEPDFEKIIDHEVGLQIVATRNPETTGNYSINLDYKHSYKLSLYGSSGNNGFSGSNGFNGHSGSHGSNGGHGNDGAEGYHGPDVGVWTDSYFDSTLNCSLLYIYAENFISGDEYKYLINPEGGNFIVSSFGRDGGRGGNGGDGADGRIWYEEIEKTRIVSKPFKETLTKKVKKNNY